LIIFIYLLTSNPCKNCLPNPTNQPAFYKFQKLHLLSQKSISRINFVFLCFTLQKNWSWESELENQIRINFEKTASDRFTDLLFRVRRDLPKKPSWICPVVFEALKEYWNTPEFKNKSEKAKKNRSSDVGGSKHTCGSIPMSEHKKRLVIFDICCYFHFTSLLKYGCINTLCFPSCSLSYLVAHLHRLSYSLRRTKEKIIQDLLTVDLRKLM